MDRVFSVGEISDQFWSAQPAAAPTTPDGSSKMNRSASEWAFQRFLQEASASDSSPAPPPPPSSASDQNDVVEIKIKEQRNPAQARNSQLHGNTNIESGSTASFNIGPPPNVPIDSKEYQAFLKSKLNLACAAVALSRVSSFLWAFWLPRK